MQSVPSINDYVVSSNIDQGSCTTLCDKVCQWLATGWWFSPATPVSSINTIDCHNIAEILLKVAFFTYIFYLGYTGQGGRWFSQWYSGFLCQWNWSSRYSWNIVESGVKHQKPLTIYRTRIWFQQWLSKSHNRNLRIDSKT